MSLALRDLLAANAGVETFTIQRIIASLGRDEPAASLMLFSIPAIATVPGTSRMVGTPAIAISGGLIAGRSGMRLPRKLLEQSVPRRSLSLAIHAVLPILERLERMTKKRWSWLCTPKAHRAIGILVFLLALPLTFPILGFGLPHAASLFTIALGMIERDGLLVALGVVAGIASLVFVTGKHLSPDALARKLGSLIKTCVERMALAREAAAVIFRRAWRWITVKLLSGAPARARQRDKAWQAPHLDAKTASRRPRQLAPSRQPTDTIGDFAWRPLAAA